MFTIRQIAQLRPGQHAGRGGEGRASRRRTRRAWGVEALEGRALLSIYVVDSPGDAGKGVGLVGDLQYAINQANQAPDNSTILFAPNLYGRAIDVGSGTLGIAKKSGTLTILGPGAGELTISGDGQGQVFDIAPSSHVTLSGLTIADGIASQGGGIENDGQLTLAGCTITGNVAVGGGGGGIYNSAFGRMTISASTISGNLSQQSDGGGIANDGVMTIAASTISGNSVSEGSGGGIANGGTLTIGQSTISGNQLVFGSGGGIYNTASLTLADDTVSQNTATASGGGIANEAVQGGTISMNNTIVADDVSTRNPRTNDIIDNGDIPGTQLTGSNDLVGAGDLGALSPSTTIVGVDPELGPLQNNGGPTMTQALLAGSPAIGGGDPTLLPDGAAYDQRGFPYSRVVHGRLDIGAFEVQSTHLIPSVARGRLAPSTPPIEILVGLTIPVDSHSSGTIGD